eukprot:CFRG8188T1
MQRKVVISRIDDDQNICTVCRTRDILGYFALPWTTWLQWDKSSVKHRSDFCRASSLHKEMANFYTVESATRVISKATCTKSATPLIWYQLTALVFRANGSQTTKSGTRVTVTSKHRQCHRQEGSLPPTLCL